jgi:hypothetical protein
MKKRTQNYYLYMYMSMRRRDACLIHIIFDDVKNTRYFHIVYLFFPKSKKTSLLRGSPGVQNVLFFTITWDKFVIYVPIRRYGDLNTLTKFDFGAQRREL